MKLSLPSPSLSCFHLLTLLFTFFLNHLSSSLASSLACSLSSSAYSVSCSLSSSSLARSLALSFSFSSLAYSISYSFSFPIPFLLLFTTSCETSPSQAFRSYPTGPGSIPAYPYKALPFWPSPWPRHRPHPIFFKTNPERLGPQ